MGRPAPRSARADSVAPVAVTAARQATPSSRPVGRLRRLQRVLVLATAGTAVSSAMTVGAGPASAGDDYPWRGVALSAGDPWGFTIRQCVSWTAFKMAQRGAPLDNHRERWGNAANWDNNSRRLGHGIGARPVVGAIAHWNPGERSPLYANGSRTANGWMVGASTGHVGYVTGVHPDGSAVVQQYNGTGSRSWSVVRVRAPRYLYVGVTPPV